MDKLIQYIERCKYPLMGIYIVLKKSRPILARRASVTMHSAYLASPRISFGLPGVLFRTDPAEGQQDLQPQ